MNKTQLDKGPDSSPLLRFEEFLPEQELTLESLSRLSSGNWRRLLQAIAQESDTTARRALSGQLTELFLEATAHGLPLEEVDLSGLDLSNFDLRGANLSRADLSSTRLDNADLSHSTLLCPLTERASFSGANLTGFYAHAGGFQVAHFQNTRMTGAQDLTGSLFHGCNMAGADFRGANLAGVSFYQCNLENANFDDTTLVGSVFNESSLTTSRFQNARLDEVVFTKCNMSDCDLAGAVGEGSIFQRLAGSDKMVFSGARLSRAVFRRCSLAGANFERSQLRGSHFALVDVNGTSFQEADLTKARFDEVSGVGARFGRASLASASFLDCTMERCSFDGCSGENAHIIECRMTACSFSGSTDSGEPTPFVGRCLTVRDSDLSNADFRGAFLYRAFFTGDPMSNMKLDRAVFSGANLIQCYLAASLVGADLTQVRAAYARLNQSILTGADLTGADLFQASMIKVVLNDAKLTGIKPPLWMDRCSGMDSAKADAALIGWQESLQSILKEERRGST